MLASTGYPFPRTEHTSGEKTRQESLPLGCKTSRKNMPRHGVGRACSLGLLTKCTCISCATCSGDAPRGASQAAVGCLADINLCPQPSPTHSPVICLFTIFSFLPFPISLSSPPCRPPSIRERPPLHSHSTTRPLSHSDKESRSTITEDVWLNDWPAAPSVIPAQAACVGMTIEGE